MQIVPATGKRLARSLGIRKFSTGKLTDPETNVKLGTFYFKGLVNQFGGAHFALASYNAGENRVERWIAERGPLPQDEFIDDIPFPETQLYVKKILGTAEDYRQLYGERRASRELIAAPARGRSARREPRQAALRFRQRLVLLAEAEAHPSEAARDGVRRGGPVEARSRAPRRRRCPRRGGARTRRRRSSRAR